MRVCVQCGENKIHSLEFRTDYTQARTLYPVNDKVAEISNDDLPYYLSGYFCEDCQECVSVVSEKAFNEVLNFMKAR